MKKSRKYRLVFKIYIAFLPKTLQGHPDVRVCAFKLQYACTSDTLLASRYHPFDRNQFSLLPPRPFFLHNGMSLRRRGEGGGGSRTTMPGGRAHHTTPYIYIIPGIKDSFFANTREIQQGPICTCRLIICGLQFHNTYMQLL